MIAEAFVLIATALPLAGTTVAVDPGHNGANGAHPAQINRQVVAGTGGFRKACDTSGAGPCSASARRSPTARTPTSRCRSTPMGDGVRAAASALALAIRRDLGR